MSASSSLPSSDPGGVFSVRIVSLDYYMSPPIPDLDFCYSAFQGGKVEEVPVIRIYGATPAGQKACLHIHRALPYLYVPFPDDKLQNPEEGQSYLYVLSRALEKALSHKSTTSKKQHVHGCSFVRAKKFYGYHSSEELFIKIYLYYPHEVARAAGLLLGGDILDRIFQPYESHIPYLLQFLVDYNLYGMGHVHTSKFKFRPPLPDSFISMDSCYRKDMLAGSSSAAFGSPAIWLSCMVKSASLWLDPATGNDDLEYKSIQLIRRQSICGLELDATVDDIINEKYKLYTPLSQSRADVKMVQSLIPIWEEEYERSGVQEAVVSPDASKPLPETVLRSFIHGLAYENALSELCLEAERSFPSKDPVEVGKKSDKYIRSSTGVGEVPTEPWRLISPYGDPEGHKSISQSPSVLSEVGHALSSEKCEFHGLASLGKHASVHGGIGNKDLKTTDTQVLGLLDWFASTQAVEDLNTDNELFHDAILSPFLPAKSYQKALEIVHMDYESASQQECQDILDSVDILKSDSHENGNNVSSDNVIPQADGSSDDKFRTPQKCDFSKISSDTGLEKFSVNSVRKCTSKRFSRKYKEKKTLWGHLPLSVPQKENADADLATLSFDYTETNNDTESSSSSGNKARSQDASKVDAGMETSTEKGEKITGCSVRDLMRRKRCFRAEQSESEKHVTGIVPEGQKDETVIYFGKVPAHPSFESENQDMVQLEHPQGGACLINQDSADQESMTCTTWCTKVSTEVVSKGHCLEPNDQLLQSNMIRNEISTRSLNVAVTSLPQEQVESIKCPESSTTPDTNIYSALCYFHSDKMPDTTGDITYCREDASLEFQLNKSCFGEKDTIGNINECFKVHFSGERSADECLKVNQTLASNTFTVCSDNVILHESRKCMNEQNGSNDQEIFPEGHFEVLRELDCQFNASTNNCLNRELKMGNSSSDHEHRKCSYSQKGKGPIEYIEKAFNRKPPSKVEVSESLEDPVQASGMVENTGICDKPLA